MSTPVRDHDTSTTHDRAPRPRRWLAPLAAAAVVALVAGLATIPLWSGDDGTDGGVAADPNTSQAPAKAGYYVVLDAPGWTVDYLDAGDSGRDELTYTNGDLELVLDTRLESEYADYVDDREHIVTPPAPGQPVEVLGLPGQTWSYSADDHTMIREPEGGTMLEVRGSGMGKADYLDLLGDLRQVDNDAFVASLPPRFVPSSARVQEILDGITEAIDMDDLPVPFGEDVPTFDAEPTDPYQFGAEVSGAVACRWLAAYSTARAAGDTATVEETAQAMATSREWPILVEMKAEGDYPVVVWQYADDMAAGRSVDGYEGALGCL